jgi:hypothetical protein
LVIGFTFALAVCTTGIAVFGNRGVCIGASPNIFLILSKLINGSFGSSTDVSLGSTTFNFLFLYSLTTLLKSSLG